jgi:MFS family permease
VSASAALAPLRIPDYRRLFAALAVSLTGDGIWVVAIAFQVIELGGGPVQLSLVVACFEVGLLGCILIGGVVADRLQRRRVMITADLVRAVVVGTVAILSLSGGLELWMLGAAGFVVGAGESFFIPSYTALVPRLVPQEQILAANGLEGTLRPVTEFAAGPALGGIAVAALSAGAAIMVDAATFIVSAACLLAIREQGTAEREPAEAGVRQAIADLREGARYVRRTSWLWTTLLFALIAVLFLIGPIDVLIPFAVTDRIDGGAGAYGTLIAAFGIGSAIGAIAVASRPLPRRYLTMMLLVWGVGALPIAVIGIANSLLPMIIAMLVVGLTSGIGDVVWGTLLQRRVPDHLRGRVSSLDFFVSLGLLPVSMVLAGPAADAFGLTAVFIVAGIVPAIIGPLALIAGRLRADEIAHPLR